MILHFWYGVVIRDVENVLSVAILGQGAVLQKALRELCFCLNIKTMKYYVYPPFLGVIYVILHLFHF